MAVVLPRIAERTLFYFGERMIKGVDREP